MPSTLKHCIIFTLLLQSPLLLALNLPVKKLTEQYIPSAYVGIVVMNADTGKILYTNNANKMFEPASNTKLLLSLAALSELGSNYRYSTDILASKRSSNLVFRFSGDPSLTQNDLDKLIKQIKIKKLNGDIILDNTAFVGSQHAMGTIYEDRNWYYNAPANTIIIDQNYFTFRLKPANKIGQPVRVISKTKINDIPPIIAHIETVSEKQAAHHCRINVNVSNNNQIKLTGCWPIQGAMSEIDLAIKNSTRLAENIIKTQLKKDHIAWHGKFITRKTPKAYTVIATHQSLPLSALIKTMLKDSNNLYARSIGKTIGKKYYGTASIQEGANAVRNILQNRFDIDLTNARLYDTAGAYYTLLTPLQMSKTLQAIYHSKFKSIFMNALPHSGKHADGTLKLLYGKQLPKHIIAKTGSMKGVSALSGYLVKRKHPLIFSILINNVIGKLKQAHQFETNVCHFLSVKIT